MKEFVFFASDDEIAALGQRMLDRTLPKRDWTHAAHFAVALWLLAYWSRERLFSLEARKGWVEPDIARLPF